jgi:probable rRNA maturation factor
VTSAVSVLDRQRKRRIGRTRLRAVVARATKALGKGNGEVVIVLGRDALLHRLNRAFRGKDAPTDVLSFEGERGTGALGDIVISIDAAERNARAQCHGLAQELEVLVLHGWLHLLGYDHERDHGTMKRVERRLRRDVLRIDRSA